MNSEPFKVFALMLGHSLNIYTGLIRCSCRYKQAHSQWRNDSNHNNLSVWSLHLYKLIVLNVHNLRDIMAATPTRGLVQSQNPLAECDRAGNPVELIIWVFWPEGGGVLAWEWGARDGRGVTPGWSFTCGPVKQTITPSVKDLSYSPLHMTISPTL